MRKVLLMAFLVPLIGQAANRQEEKQAPAKDAVAIGKDLPGPLNPFNVNGASKNRFHDPIGPHDLDPFVLVFTNDIEFSDDLKKVFQDIDNAIEKNPNTRIAACCVFFSANVTNVLTDDDAREELTAKLDALAKELMLKHLILAIDSPDNLPKYAEFVAGTRIVLLNKLRVLGFYGGEKLAADDGAKLLTDLADKLGAKRK